MVYFLWTVGYGRFHHFSVSPLANDSCDSLAITVSRILIHFFAYKTCLRKVVHAISPCVRFTQRLTQPSSHFLTLTSAELCFGVQIENIRDVVHILQTWDRRM